MTIEEIKAVLEKATPGPWQICMPEQMANREMAPLRVLHQADNMGMIFKIICKFHEIYTDISIADATLTAEAPALAALVLRLAEALEQIVGPNETVCPCCNEIETCLSDCTYAEDCPTDATDMEYLRMRLASARALLREIRS